MTKLTLVIALSTVLWYVIDRFKPLWESVKNGKYITTAVAALGSFAIVFAFKLDVIFAAGLVEELSIPGEILTAFVIMSGSSAISEIITKIKS